MYGGNGASRLLPPVLPRQKVDCRPQRLKIGSRCWMPCEHIEHLYQH
jgi:hypothetical protein